MKNIILATLFISICAIRDVNSFQLRVMKVVMSNDPHSGMDGGIFGKRWFGYGGDFEMTICSSPGRQNCCQTGELNTSDNNWEKGETNFFIGHQLHHCENFDLSTSVSASLKVQHYGSDGGKIQRVELRGALRHQNELVCVVETKLDNSESVTVNCVPNVETDWNTPLSNNDGKNCMGKPEFCNVKFNQFSFAGSHNAGTGMSGSIKPIECLYKNHDLNLNTVFYYSA